MRAKVHDRLIRTAVGLALTAVLACAPDSASDPEADRSSGAAAAAAEFALTAIDPPAAPGSIAPQPTSVAGKLALSWLEPVEQSSASSDKKQWRVRFSRFDGDEWSEPVSIVEGEGLFANWADFPSVVEGGDGVLYAHWLSKIDVGTYAYGVRLGRSDDGGSSWRTLGWLHDDQSPTEHGFVTMIPTDAGIRAIWLDGRATADGEPMQLRSTLVSSERVDGQPGASEILDDSVCDCCSTTAVATSKGTAVLYRDRTREERRDISRVFLPKSEPTSEVARWSRSAPVADDGWIIPACPVNGPRAVAAGDYLWANWFTAANARRAVYVARSIDGGLTFEDAIEIDGDGPLGRVDALALDNDLVVAWLATRRVAGGDSEDGTGGEIHLRRVSSNGVLGAAIAAVETSTQRSSGFPRLGRLDSAGDELVLSWVDVSADASTIRVARFDSTEVPE